MTYPGNTITIRINNETCPLRLTLGALADIEAAFGGDVGAMQARLKSPRVSDILLILHALLAGGGATLTMEALKASDIDIAEAARAIAQAFEALGAGDDAEAPGKPAPGAA